VPILPASLPGAGTSVGVPTYPLDSSCDDPACYGRAKLRLQSPIADLRNSAGPGPGSGAGAGLGAHFIGAWVDEDMPWAHLDIAGMAWRETEGLPASPIRASGFGVRLLDRFVREYYE